MNIGANPIGQTLVDYELQQRTDELREMESLTERLFWGWRD